MDKFDFTTAEQDKNSDPKCTGNSEEIYPPDLHINKNGIASNVDQLHEDEECLKSSIEQGDVFTKDSCTVKFPGLVPTDQGNIDTNSVKKETDADDTRSHDSNIDHVTVSELETEDDFSLEVVVALHNNLSLQSNDKTETNIINEDTEIELVQDIDNDNHSVTGNEDNVELDSRLAIHTCCHSNTVTHKVQGKDDITTITEQSKNAVEHNEWLLPSYEPDDFANTFLESNSNGNHAESFPIPFFDHIDDETECPYIDFPKNRQNVLSQIPNFDLLQFDDNETAGGSGCEDFDVVELLKEIRNDLKRRNDDSDDLGLVVLFDEPNSRNKHGNTSVKSKSARKRKKQQLKLRKTQVTNLNTGNVRQKFAQSFQELQNNRMELHDYNMDAKYTCPVCLEMYHMPNICNPCTHMFCDPCLRRMTGQGYEGIPCPLCRTVISSCHLDKDFDEKLLLEYPDIYTARAMFERKTKFRHYRLPYTAPVPLGKRLMRQLIASRNIQSDTRWMSHDWFKFLLGCTVGMCISLLIMLFNHVKTVRDARDVNIVFLSVLVGASVTFFIFKVIKI